MKRCVIKLCSVFLFIVLSGCWDPLPVDYEDGSGTSDTSTQTIDSNSDTSETDTITDSNRFDSDTITDTVTRTDGPDTDSGTSDSESSSDTDSVSTDIGDSETGSDTTIEPNTDVEDTDTDTLTESDSLDTATEDTATEDTATEDTSGGTTDDSSGTEPECTDGASDCDDLIDCTANLCISGECQYPLLADMCFIGGECFADGDSQPGNGCMVCNATENPNDWTARAENESCDDSLWCNGEDRCDAGGMCIHTYPDNDRCVKNDVCESDVCTEEYHCYAPPDTPCNEEFAQYRCTGTGCGADAEKKPTYTYCSGTSSVCDGVVAEADWEPFEECTDGQTCWADAPASMGTKCLRELECECMQGNNWYDASTELCWQNPAPTGVFPLSDARTYCQLSTFDPIYDDWREPTLVELVSLIRGCADGDNSDPAATAVDTCILDCVDDTCTVAGSPCLSDSGCTAGEGPDENGCYWDPALEGSCDLYEYWTSSFASSLGTYVNFGTGVPQMGLAPSNYVRCVKSWN
jgi:hypothetical protein